MNSQNPDGDFGELTLACLDDGQRAQETKHPNPDREGAGI
jgi:hypothetical protein